MKDTISLAVYISRPVTSTRRVILLVCGDRALNVSMDYIQHQSLTCLGVLQGLGGYPKSWSELPCISLPNISPSLHIWLVCKSDVRMQTA